MMEGPLVIFIICWGGAGLLGWFIGHFMSWWEGKDLTVGDLIASAVYCGILGGICLVCVAIYLIARLFNVNTVVLRGRGRCKECDAKGYHKMSCSQRYKDLGDA